MHNQFFNYFAEPYQGNRDCTKPVQETFIQPWEGFVKGNLVNELYTPYFNYVPKEPRPMSERERFLLPVQALDFARVEMNLYLDNHPNEASVIQQYARNQQALNEAKAQYEEKFGPLQPYNATAQKTPWSWVEYWPWMGGAS